MQRIFCGAGKIRNNDYYGGNLDALNDCLGERRERELIVIEGAGAFLDADERYASVHDFAEEADKFLGDPPRRYQSGKGGAKMECCLFDIDTETGRCVKAEALRVE